MPTSPETAWSTIASFLGYRNSNIPIHHPAGMIPLEIKRSRLGFTTVQRPARNPRDLLVIDRRHAIPNHRHHATHEGDVKALPSPRLPRQVGRWSDEPIDRPHAMELVVGVDSLVLDLHFIPAAQVDPAVALVRAVVLDMQFEVVELPRATKIRPVCFVQDHAVLHHPMIRSWSDRLPSCHVFSIEQRFRIGPRLGRIALQCGRAYAGQFRGYFISVLLRSTHLIALHSQLPSDLWPLFRRFRYQK